MSRQSKEKDLPPDVLEQRGVFAQRERADDGRKSTEKPLLEALPSVVRFLEEIADTVIVVDRDWRLIHLNRQALKQAGCPLEELLGRSLWELYPGLRGTTFEINYRRAMAEQVLVHFDAPSALGGRWYEIYACPSPQSLTIYGRDTTDRRQAEEKLRESEERHRILSEVSTDYCYACRVDADGTIRIESATEGFIRVTGYTVEELEAKGGWPTLIHPDDLHLTPETVQRILADQRDVTELRIRTKGGETRWIRYSTHPIWDAAQGRVVRLLGAVQDLTERKRAEEGLRQSEERLKALFRAIPVPTYTWQKSGQSFILADYNAAAAVITRGKIADYLGQRADDMYPDLPDVVQDMTRCFSERTAIHREMVYRFRSTGETRHLAVKYAYVPPDLVLVHTEDVSERMRAEEALRETNETLQSLIQGSPLAIIALAPDGSVTLWNPAAEHIFGWRAEEVLGKPLPIIPRGKEREYHAFREAELRGEAPRASEIRRQRKDGSLVDVSLWTAPVRDASGAVRSTIGILADITDRKRAEAELKELAERLRVLSRRLLEVQELERRYLARELHDEVGQLLTGLRFILESCAGLSADNLERKLGEAKELLRDLTGHVRDLSLRLRPTMLDDLGLLAALLWHIERYSAQTGVRVAFEHRGLDRRFPAELETAAYRIIQEAVTNVARHAGVVEVVVRVWSDRDTLCIRVEDQGCGFDAQAVRAVGTASGLSGMRERADLLGGSVTVESVPGAGTRVTAELPVRQT